MIMFKPLSTRKTEWLFLQSGPYSQARNSKIVLTCIVSGLESNRPHHNNNQKIKKSSIQKCGNRRYFLSVSSLSNTVTAPAAVPSGSAKRKPIMVINKSTKTNPFPMTNILFRFANRTLSRTPK